jgi:hypothetical protein
LTSYLIKEYGKEIEDVAQEDFTKKEIIRKKFDDNLKKALCSFRTQPLIWVEPILSSTNEISSNPDENYNNRINIADLINKPTSTLVKAPPQFGLTSLSHYLIKQAWAKGDFWLYIDCEKTKAHNIHNVVKNETQILGLSATDVKCIVLDNWYSYEANAIKKLKNLCEANKEIPIIVMQTIDDSKFLTEPNTVNIDRDFNVLHLLALPRTQIRKVVQEYNKEKDIGDEETVLSKVLSDLETLNIHRTPLNCLTLLKVSEKHFDDSPVNRTNMLEMVLFVLFNMDGIPRYKTRPDLKDCEYIIGRFCEKLIKHDFYEFSRESFLGELNNFCKEKLIDLEVDIVFDILVANNILINKDNNYIFRASYWIFYFAAKRMHNDQDFADYIFSSKKYVSFPEVIEFYTGIDRNRSDALNLLLSDISSTCDIVRSKVNLPDNMNPFALIQWRPSQEQIEKARNEISENVLSSGLPDSLKDQHADKSYNQIRPYNQSIQAFFEEYSVQNLMQEIKATSRALRNSDYVEPNIKRIILKEILKSWIQISKVIFALTPVLASKGSAKFEGAAFQLIGDFGNTEVERANRIIQVIPTNIVGFFMDDLFSSKIGPLLYEQFENETDPLIKHELALLFVIRRPRDWKKHIENYIYSINKNSFYLFDIVNVLKAKYRYDFTTELELRDIQYLIKMGLAKHEFGGKPTIDKVIKIDNSNLPKREYSAD